MVTIHLEFTAKPDDALTHLLLQGKQKEAYQKRQLGPSSLFGYTAKDNDTILGGVTATAFYGCLYIDMLWVAPEFRGLSIGSKLVHVAEAYGKDIGCSFSVVNTMDFEARVFYEKLGYHVEFVRYGFDSNSHMYLMRKDEI